MFALGELFSIFLCFLGGDSGAWVTLAPTSCAVQLPRVPSPIIVSLLPRSNAMFVFTWPPLPPSTRYTPLASTKVDATTFFHGGVLCSAT